MPKTWQAYRSLLVFGTAIVGKTEDVRNVFTSSSANLTFLYCGECGDILSMESFNKFHSYKSLILTPGLVRVWHFDWDCDSFIANDRLIKGA